MRERKFNFLPIKPHKAKPKIEFKPFVKIQSNGTLTFGKTTMDYLKISGPVFIKLFGDNSKRALGFKITKEGGSKENGYRLLTPKSYTNNSTMCILSIRSFLNQLTNVHLPSPRLFIREYNDTDQEIGIGKVYYIKVPYGKATKDTSDDD
jgi:hypothetical protein